MFFVTCVCIVLPFLLALKLAGGVHRRYEGDGLGLLGVGVVLALLSAAVLAAVFGTLSGASWTSSLAPAWWSLGGSLWLTLPSAGLGLAFVRLRRARRPKTRWVVPALLLLLALIPSGVRSQLVEENRFRSPEWRDGVCMQSTWFTCTAAAGATLLRAYGVDAGESEMAKRCGTQVYGTNVLGLAQGLRSGMLAQRELRQFLLRRKKLEQR